MGAALAALAAGAHGVDAALHRLPALDPRADALEGGALPGVVPVPVSAAAGAAAAARGADAVVLRAAPAVVQPAPGVRVDPHLRLHGLAMAQLAGLERQGAAGGDA